MEVQLARDFGSEDQVELGELDFARELFSTREDADHQLGDPIFLELERPNCRLKEHTLEWIH